MAIHLSSLSDTFHSHRLRYPPEAAVYIPTIVPCRIVPVWPKCCACWLLLSNIYMPLTLIVQISYDIMPDPNVIEDLTIAITKSRSQYAQHFSQTGAIRQGTIVKI